MSANISVRSTSKFRWPRAFANPIRLRFGIPYRHISRKSPAKTAQLPPRAAAEKEPVWRLIGVNAIKRIASADHRANHCRWSASALERDRRGISRCRADVCIYPGLPRGKSIRFAKEIRTYPRLDLRLLRDQGERGGDKWSDTWISGRAIRPSKIAFILPTFWIHISP